MLAAGLMLRVNMLYRHVDLSHRDTLNRLVAIVIDESAYSEVDAATTTLALEVIQLCLAWQLRSMGDNADQQQSAGLSLRVRAFASQLGLLLEHPQPVVQYQAYIVLLDVLSMFSKALSETGLRRLAYVVSEDTAQKCQRFVVGVVEGDIDLMADPELAGPGDDEDNGEDSGLDDTDRTARLQLLRARRLVATFLHACAYNVMPGKSHLFGAPLLAYYNKTLGEYLKEYLRVLRHSDPQLAPEAMLHYFKEVRGTACAPYLA